MITLQAIGHLGKDATVNNVNGKTVINFSIAHSEKYKNAEGSEVTKTLWVECSYWNDRTKIAQFLKKGTQIHVAGVPSLDSYRNTDGVTVAKLRLRITDITLLGGGKKDEQPAEASPTPAAPAGETQYSPVVQEDAPF